MIPFFLHSGENIISITTPEGSPPVIVVAIMVQGEGLLYVKGRHCEFENQDFRGVSRNA